MLSLTSGRKVAIIDDNRKEFVFLKNDDEGEPEIETTPDNKLNIFKKYLQMDKKLSVMDISTLIKSYEKGDDSIEGKLNRKYDNAIQYVKNSLKKHLDYGTKHKLFPIIDEDSYRLFVSGLSGSGKSYFISEFLKYNKPKVQGAGIFLFSPVKEDKAFKNIKNLIHLDLEELFETMKGKDLEIEDIPDGSVVVFDDLESFPKNIRKKYMDLRDTFLERGRGHSEGQKGISTITVSHNARNGNATKASIRESQYWVLFPTANKVDVKNLFKLYGGLDTKDIDLLMNQKSRWCFFKKSIPQYAIGEHSIVVI